MTADSAKLKVIITGSTGMVGKGVLLECLDSSYIESVLIINRHPLGLKHAKLKEIVHQNFFDLSPISNELTGYDACYFCLGVSVLGMSESDYRHVTYDLTMHMAETVIKNNSSLCFCYVSGAGTDSSEKGRSMWARIKGKTENALLAMPFRDAYMFRPGYIQPMRGIRSKTTAYNAVYLVSKPLYPVLKRLFPNSLTTTEAMGKAMINAARIGYEKKILHARDINSLAKR